jgi:hypothetical protein
MNLVNKNRETNLLMKDAKTANDSLSQQDIIQQFCTLLNCLTQHQESAQS